jgi:hypothetical protein
MAGLDETVQMMKFMAEQITKLVEAQKEAAMNFSNQAKGVDSKRGQWDQTDKYRNVKMFNGDSKDWDEFATKLRSQVAAGDGQAAEILDVVETEMKEEDLEAMDWTMLADERFSEDDLKQVSERFHNLLLNLTTGEANAVVRRCRRNGLWAWKRLCTTLNPRTLASGVKAISAVLAPGKIACGAKADQAIEVWEDKMSKLSTEYGEQLSAKMKVAVLYGMLPKDLQERVLDKCAVNWDGMKETDALIIYNKVREEVKNIAKSRRDMSNPRPMEVDRVQVEKKWWADEFDDEEGAVDGEQEHDINYVGKGGGKKGGKGFQGNCYLCGEFGHSQWECSKGKGKAYYKGGGKDGFYYNKGVGKEGGKGQAYGKGYGKEGYYTKGSGKDGGKGGMMRACFGCGSTDHLLKDCPKRGGAIQSIEQQEPEEVFFIGNVRQEMEPWKKVPMKVTVGDFIKNPKGALKAGKKIQVTKENAFKILEPEDDDSEAEIMYVRTVEDVTEDKGEKDDAKGMRKAKVRGVQLCGDFGCRGGQCGVHSCIQQ